MGAGKSKGKHSALSEEDLKFLLQNTRFDSSTIETWYKEFMAANPTGRMTREQFIDEYGNVFHQGDAEEYCNHAFRAFDTNQNGFIEFSEFLIAVSMFSKGTAHQKLDFVFRMYDIDGNGKLEKSEVQEIIRATCTLLQHHLRWEDPDAHAEAIFSSLDVDHNGVITKGEFVRGCQNYPQMLAYWAPSEVASENHPDFVQ